MNTPLLTLRPLRLLALPSFLLLITTNISSCRGADVVGYQRTLEIQVVDENGQPISDAQIESELETRAVDFAGIVRLRNFEHPREILVSAPGYVSENRALGYTDVQSRTVVALRTQTPGRITMHFGGDAMFGRRYETIADRDPLIPSDAAGPGSVEVVRRLGFSFTQADFRSFNLETVLTLRSYIDAYPGKRFLLRSHPETALALQALKADVVTFANNHARDFLDIGVLDTLSALAEYNVPTVGGGMTQAEAEAAIIQDIAGQRVCTFSYTTVTGSFVNDSYPDESAIPNNDVSAKDLWMFTGRSWGFSDPRLEIPTATRRIGTAWRLYSDMESNLDESLRADVWGSMVLVYPELQDWVARRGHGGSAMWSTRQSTAAIEAIRSDCDVIIVQLHAGFQFQPVPSGTVRNAAHNAIDAGADLVIAHHPHVLQGMEFYREKLVAFSLGNFIFDQDFLATFPSGYIRVRWQDALQEAYFIPTVLWNYVPLRVTDGAARRVLRDVWERSQISASSARAPDGSVRVVVDDEDTESTDIAPAQLIFEGQRARITAKALPETLVLDIPAQSLLALDDSRLYDSTASIADNVSPGSLFIGRDIFGWGRFEDEAIDGQLEGALHWKLDSSTKSTVFGDASDGQAFLRLSKSSTSLLDTLARPIARIPLTPHRFWSDEKPQWQPADGPAKYTIRFDARANIDLEAGMFLDIYHFDDSNPTEDPGSDLLKRESLSFEVAGDGQWQTVEIPFDPDDHEVNGLSANMIMPYFRLPPQPHGDAILDIDHVQFIEWRDVREQPRYFGAFDWLWNAQDVPVQVNLDTLRSSPTPTPMPEDTTEEP